MRNPKTILLVDNDADVVRGMRLRLSAAGYDTVIATDADAGVRAARESHPHAIVMDIEMPGASGLDALDSLKADTSTQDIPIVMLSGCVGHQTQALDRGARYFLRKPYTGADVLRALASAMDESEKTSTARRRSIWRRNSARDYSQLWGQE